MGGKDDTANPDAKPPAQPQHTIDSEPEEPADHGQPVGGEDASSDDSQRPPD